MKTFLTFTLFALTAVAAPAQEAADHFTKQVGILIEYYEVDHAKITPLLRDYQKQPNASQLLSQTREMEKMKGARLMESTYLVTRSGQRAKIESIRELIYPTEYDPAELPEKLEGPVDRDAKIVTPGTPTAYEMRPVGNTLEVDPVITADGNHVELNLSPELVEFHGFDKWGQGVSEVTLPRIHSLKTSASITVKFGTSELLGVLTPSGALHQAGKGKRVLCFVTPQRLSAVSRETFAEFEKDPKKWKVENTQIKQGETVADPFAAPDSENVPPPKPKQVSLLTEYIEVDAALASRLVREIQPTSDASLVRKHVLELIEKGGARRLETGIATTRSGQRAKVESIHEMMYPTEYDPPEVPQTLKGPVDRDADVITSTGATAFKMRPTGLSVEVDPVISPDGSEIDLNIAPEMVDFIRTLEYGKGPSLAQQPLFETIKVSTAVTLPDGQPILLGMHSLETARAAEMGTKEERSAVRNRRVLVFVTAKIKTPE